MRVGVLILTVLLVLSVDAMGAIRPPDSRTVPSGSSCTPARGVGTIAPAISILSMTIVVNGLERTVRGDDTLEVSPGDEVQVRDVTICAAPFTGDGGNVCVDISPTARSGQAIFSEHRGTHMMPVTSGIIEISGLDYRWTVAGDWKNLTAVVNHWTPEKTKDFECAGGLCERDDRIVLEFR